MQANSAATLLNLKPNPKPSHSNSSLGLEVSLAGSNRGPLHSNNSSRLVHNSLVLPSQELPKVPVYLARHRPSPLLNLAAYSVNHKRNRGNSSSQVHYLVPQLDKPNQVCSSLVSNQVVFLDKPTLLLDRHPLHNNSQVNQPLAACSVQPRLLSRVLLNQEQIKVHHYLPQNLLSQDYSNSQLAAVLDYLVNLKPNPPPLVYSKQHHNNLIPLVNNHSRH